MRVVAHYNRKWTQELVDRLRRDVDEFTVKLNGKKGDSRKAAFSKLVPIWNLSSRTIGQVYYGGGGYGKFGQTQKASKELLPPIEKIEAANKPSLPELVKMVQLLGGTITINLPK